MELPGSRVLIQEEEVKFRGPVSEAVVQKMAGSTNLFTKQVDTLRWAFQGQFGDTQWPIVADGCRMLYRDYEVVGFGMWMYGTGVDAFPYEISLFRYNNTDTPASIFTTPPVWTMDPSPSFNQAWIYDLATATTINGVYGTFNVPTLDADVPLNRGDWLGWGIEKAPNFAFNLEFQLFIRVR